MCSGGGCLPLSSSYVWACLSVFADFLLHVWACVFVSAQFLLQLYQSVCQSELILTATSDVIRLIIATPFNPNVSVLACCISCHLIDHHYSLQPSCQCLGVVEKAPPPILPSPSFNRFSPSDLWVVAIMMLFDDTINNLRVTGRHRCQNLSVLLEINTNIQSTDQTFFRRVFALVTPRTRL